MAIRRRLNILSQLRVDVPDLKSIESASSNDFDELLRGLITGANKSYVIRGFEIEMAGSIGSSANSLQMIVENSFLLHGTSSTSGTFFIVPSGTPTQTMSSTVNPKVVGSFTPGALNYIGIEYSRQIDNSTAIQRYFWSPSTKSEFVKTVPQAELLDYRIVITSSIFAANVLPISIVETDGANNVLSIEDRRPMLFRLGTAGSNTPDPFYEYPWNNQLEGRVENLYISSSSTVSPFRGGDKQIYNMKEMFDALMTEIKLIKGTPYWYSLSTGGSISKLRADTANTIVTSKGTVTHNPTVSGRINWSNDIELVVIGSRIAYKILANPSSTDITLLNDQVAYITLNRDINVIPNIIFTNGSPVATSVGAVSWTTSLVAGDYVKPASGGEDKYYEILSVDSPSQVTLVQNWAESSTGVNGTKVQYAFGVFQTTAVPTTDRHVKIADKNDVTINQDNYWLFLRHDTGVVAPQETSIITVADVAGSLNGLSFKLYSNDNLRKYRFYFDDGTAADPSDPDEIAVAIPLIHDSTDSEIASAMSDIIDEQTDFNTTLLGNTVTVTNALDGNSIESEDVDTTFSFTTTVPGIKAKAYARFFGSELEQGETRQVSDNVNFEIINYIGSRSETDGFPEYSTAFEQITVLSFDITFPDAAAITSGQSAILYSVTDNTKYRMWLNKDGAGGNPSIIDEEGIELVISTGFTAIQNAAVATAAISATGDFNVVDNLDGSITVTLDEAGRTTFPSNADIPGLDIEILTMGSGEANYYLKDGENLTQGIKRLDAVIHRILDSITDDAYEEQYEIVVSSSNIYEVTGPVVATTQLSLPLNSKKNNAVTGYKVGSNQLEIFLNGLYQRRGIDWDEVGSVDDESTLFELLVDYEIGDLVVFRIDTGTLGPTDTGNIGSSSIYDNSLEVVASGAGAGEINGPILAGNPITLPASKTYVGDELQVYLNGNFTEPGIDYTAFSSTEIAFLYDINVGDLVRFRIEPSGGGSGSNGGGLLVNAGEANTASNAGPTGAGLFKTKVGVDLQFKKIIGGAGVTVFEGPNAVTLTAAPTAAIDNVVTTTSADYVATVANDYIRVFNAGSDVTVTLPAASTIGKQIKIKKRDSGNVLYVATIGGETIDDIDATATPLMITSYNEAIILITGASGSWEIL